MSMTSTTVYSFTIHSRIECGLEEFYRIISSEQNVVFIMTSSFCLINSIILTFRMKGRYLNEFLLANV